MQRFILVVLAVTSLLVTGCAQKSDQVVTISTPYGDMIAILYDETPKHKENFLKLVGKGYYDSLLFHRVIQGFMIQGGDPDSKHASRSQRLGNGGPGYTIPAEFNPKLIHVKGALSAARLSDQMNPEKASSGSQFYIVQGAKQSESQLRVDHEKYNRALQQFFQKPDNQSYRDSINFFMQHGDQKGFQSYLERLQPVVEEQLHVSVNRDIAPEALEAYTTIGGTPQLDGDYTVFGKVIHGRDVIDKIEAVQCDINNRPVEDVRMTITVKEMPLSEAMFTVERPYRSWWEHIF